ncbi:MAG TPA: hypothetical protein VHL57_07935 [Flavobacteriales bacterium]|nr:hypothetical protein [Flavobacteriales bacterium]
MAKKRLSEKDVDQLLGHYRAERRRLSFQLEQIRTSIADLRKIRTTSPKAAATARVNGDGTPKRGPGRPRKNEVVVKAKGRPGRPKKRERKERDLNGWDNMVISAIKSSQRLLPKEDLLRSAKSWAASHEPSVKGAEVEAHLTRTLQKLSGRKKMLGTHHSGLRRGYHYGLKDWFFQSSGKLRKQHFDKLVLTKDEK